MINESNDVITGHDFKALNVGFEDDIPRVTVRDLRFGSPMCIDGRHPGRHS